MTTFCWLPPDNLPSSWLTLGVFTFKSSEYSVPTVRIFPSSTNPPMLKSRMAAMTVLALMSWSSSRPKVLRSSDR